MEHDMTCATETARVQAFYDKIASSYDRFMGLSEKVFFGNGRSWVCSQASGKVLEIAIGTGRNFPYYPADIQLTGIELSPAMLALAKQKAAELGREVDLQVGDAQALPFPDVSFNTVVATLALCTIPDERQAVAEVKRVLRPSGRFLLLEHVRSPNRAVRAIQRVLEPLTVRFQADHLTRDPLPALEAEGFVIEQLERTKWGIVERIAAHKPR
jgi:ubiquinone/menaquinone biosynthesis C-methylase UbiE